ncbi:MAG: hypothetical protein JWR37_3731 [Mycobacterium sp.]|nr:hypothetical protein [Mycobacterium sp.]
MTTGPDIGADRLRCVHCGAHYAPALVKQRCPVCRTPARGPTHIHQTTRDTDDHMPLIVALATVTNLLVLAILAAYLIS